MLSKPQINDGSQSSRPLNKELFEGFETQGISSIAKTRGRNKRDMPKGLTSSYNFSQDTFNSSTYPRSSNTGDINAEIHPVSGSEKSFAEKQENNYYVSTLKLLTML